ncbi:MAG: bifunctional enoyl-CoA hydratase/phosphate acetyltransferase [Burkholderiales bacterium]|nr:bifunctional enoyl-CoA hydratase/phosphate acetyltransferase [Burkholderiales bacterium]
MTLTIKPQLLENRTFEEITVGESAAITRVLNKDDIDLFAILSGDVNPAHLDEAYAAQTPFHKVIAHGMWGGTLISTVLGTKLPGPGTIYLSQQLKFQRPVCLGDVITVTVTVAAKNADKNLVTLDCVCTNQAGKTVIVGTAEVMAPTVKVRRESAPLPDLQLRRHPHFSQLLAHCQPLDAIPAAVAYPCDINSLTTVLQAAQAGVIKPILVGPSELIKRVATDHDLDLSACQWVEAITPSASIEAAIQLARSGDAQVLYQGAMPLDETLQAVLNRTTGLRTDRRMSHVYLIDSPDYTQPLMITDGALIIQPTLEDKRHIVQNAIDLVKTLGMKPKVAILSAADSISSALPSSTEATALCKMAERGQIHGGDIDGPLSFDSAISPAAAQAKGLKSPVAGQANVLVVPNIEVGDMLAKQLTFMAGAVAAEIVLGGQVPIILNNAAASEQTRVASAAVALVLANAKATATKS